MGFNPKKQLQIEIHQNDLSNSNGYTIWRVISGERKNTLSRNADGKDFDWMTEKQINDFEEKEKYKFTISAADASEYFQYVY